MRPSAAIAINTRKPKYVAFIFSILAVCLNQAYVTLGVNASLSDGFLVVALIYLMITNSLLIPRLPTAFFFYLSATMLCVSVYYVPTKFIFAPSTLSITTEYLKLVALFSYFLLGYNTKSIPLAQKAARSYSYAATIIGVVGLFSMLFKPEPLFNFICPDGLRLQGIMNDPNYFAIVQVSALAYFTRSVKLTSIQKSIGSITLILSVLFSGSKTGTIALLLYAIWRLFGWFLSRQPKVTSVYKVAIIFISLVVLSISGVLTKVLGQIALAIPASERILSMLVDFTSSISIGGSDRSATWSVAAEIIRSSPVFGVGIATYVGIAKEIFGDTVGATVVAHNTYLQILAEWGAIWTTLFLAYLFSLITVYTGEDEVNKIVRDILVVFLIGSLGISLNNARIFWFFLGTYASLRSTTSGSQTMSIPKLSIG